MILILQKLVRSIYFPKLLRIKQILYFGPVNHVSFDEEICSKYMDHPPQFDFSWVEGKFFCCLKPTWAIRLFTGLDDAVMVGTIMNLVLGIFFIHLEL